MKEIFLQAMGNGHQISEYVLPRDCPTFCTGCKACFYRDINACPHSKYTLPIWDSILMADLLVFVSPTYVFHVTAQMKALLDHFASKWMSHSPEEQLFNKQAVIITNAVGQGMGKTARDIKDSLDFWGLHVILMVIIWALGHWVFLAVFRRYFSLISAILVHTAINFSQGFIWQNGIGVWAGVALYGLFISIGIWAWVSSRHHARKNNR